MLDEDGGEAGRAQPSCTRKMSLTASLTFARQLSLANFGSETFSLHIFKDVFNLILLFFYKSVIAN